MGQADSTLLVNNASSNDHHAGHCIVNSPSTSVETSDFVIQSDSDSVIQSKSDTLKPANLDLYSNPYELKFRGKVTVSSYL